MAPKRKATAKSATPADEVEGHGNEETMDVETHVEAESASQAAPEESSHVAAAAAEAAAPYTPVPVSGSTTEIYSQLQTILSADSSKVNYYLPQLLELVQASESAETPLLMRVRFVEFVGHHVSQVRDNNALRKVVTSLVKIVGGEDNTPQLLTAAVQAFAGLGPVSVVDKNWEYLAREGADVLMQVMIDREAFPESVRQAAAKSLDSLTNTAFRSVLAKLLHWLSLDREDDDEEQISKERHMALTRLSRVVMAPAMQRQHWNEEMEKYAEPLLQRVLGTVNMREFAQLARICASLPMNKSKGNLPLLEWYVSTHRLKDERDVEAVAIIGRHIASTVEYDLTSALEAAGLLGNDVSGADDHSVSVAKVILLASRLAPAEAAEKLYTYVNNQVAAMMADMHATLTSFNLVTVEALLFAAVAVARKRPAEALQKLNNDAFNASAVAAAQAATTLHHEVVFAVKKAATNKEATAVDADAAASLLNIKTILEAFAAKRLPLAELHESWTRGANPMPAMKRSRDEPRGTMPPPPGSRAAEAVAQKRHSSSHQQERKRPHNDHVDRSRGRNPNNSGDRSHDRNGRRPRRDNRH
ncbi:hypothetical protein ABB37_00025 [Leptomonas pyrrhocoris]|uniref:Uncharacterized protein n=1 Tax=Leptomonas pyrrhocoris TaxID=157538 RepID=A0A0N0VHK4_LEPPY|nr:hypothetical protein ABB37_00025 [Leptomonas pyrrhocoris]KPA85621.1 hypothetical protein ABB37_00025 [Leptomonas pyrrhocoris]|eukprot:XP_015664060.1 hypothetical protein ABB37_00025 [Leptomonas pyrrhocoris]